MIVRLMSKRKGTMFPFPVWQGYPNVSNAADAVRVAFRIKLKSPQKG